MHFREMGSLQLGHPVNSGQIIPLQMISQNS